MDQLWANRAASCEAAVTQRHLRRLWGLPATQLGVVAWPPARRERLFGTWHYWWQAHLLDCLVDAQQRDPQPQRRARINRQVRSHRLRNNLSWTNSYYDDMAWLALALERAARIAGVHRRKALPKLANQFLRAWVPEDGGGIPWRKSDQFFNAPANGPAGIFLARYGDHLKRAEQMANWIDETLIDPETHLVFDGIKAGSLVRAQYTYCQGVVLGLETELAARTDGPARQRRRRAVRRCHGPLPGARHHAAGVCRRGRRGPRHRPADRAGQREVGLGLPANRGRAAGVRPVLGPRRPVTHGRRQTGGVRRGRGDGIRDRRAGPVGAAVGVDAHGGRM